MSDSDRSPKSRAKSYECPRCGAFASQEWFEVWGTPVEGGSMQRVQDPNYMENLYGQALRRTPAWDLARCYACKKYALWVDKALVFPDPDKLSAAAHHLPSDDMPTDTRTLFQEAVAVLPHSKRAAAALCRAAM